MSKNNPIIIIGAGMVGLSLANQLRERFKSKKVFIFEKENKIGLHSSGRNSGVLHAGIYYKPNTLKSRVCINGAKRLKKWCEEEKIEVLNCGKYIVAQDKHLDKQLDLIFDRGKKNGAKVEMISKKTFQSLVPFGRAASDRAIWSPNTSVVNPKEVVAKLKEKLSSNNVSFYLNHKMNSIDFSKKRITFKQDDLLKEFPFEHIFNCAGAYSDEVARLCGIAKNFKMLPFKGVYWELNKDSQIEFNTNLYPVPDLNVPFLGVHVTPSINGEIFLGPSAIPAFGRENYKWIENIELLKTLQFSQILSSQFLKNENGFRKYAIEQGLHGFKYFFFKSAQKLIPNLKIDDLILSKKVGIRPQLFDTSSNKLNQDFLIENYKNTTHILNAISPAFTASFEFADLIIDKSLMM